MKEKEIEVKIYSIATSITESIIFLDEINGIRLLPIWIGPFEAQAIAMKMSGYASPRPMTHDLIYKIINKLGGKIIKTVISDIEDNTYFAKIHIEKNGEILEIDSRPSDAIALAVRSGSPIYVAEKIFNSAQTVTKPITEEEVSEFKEKLKNMTPKDIIGENLPKNKEKEEGDDNEQETDNR
ncbi:MAG: bifunctional nuclease family protein [Elusimicrobiales bacterium]|jgi:bifunctional DNase/RNase|nr:bifunctional nuclease family protein [Elusimicrobiales bacterium]HOL62161.1 bifunctional nuclease family protein [Elusimicrobiales bacterium]HPO95530.1 bifunctional nuclease family protein [Elusimicrobiales bacterium]